VNDTPSIHPMRPESEASSGATPLFGSEADSFVQQLRLAAQAHLIDPRDILLIVSSRVALPVI
jgi:hypothetical protein